MIFGTVRHMRKDGAERFADDTLFASNNFVIAQMDIG